MAKPLKKLQAKLTALVKSKEAFAKHMTQDELIEYVDMLITAHRNIVAALDTYAVSNSNQSTLAKKIKAVQNPKAFNLDQYLDFRNRLQNSVQAVEIKKPLTTLYKANMEYVDIMTSLREAIPEFFESDKVNIFNLRLSHVVILGLLYQSEILQRFSAYTLVLVTNAIRGEDDFPKYRVTFLKENSQLVAKLTNAIYNKSGAHNLRGMIKQIKRNANDFLLLDDKNVPQAANASAVEKEVGNMIESGTDGFNIFLAIGVQNNVRHKARRERMLRDLEWMRSHVACLLYDLGNKDKNTPEYKKLVETIEYYETEIRKLERKLQV